MIGNSKNQSDTKFYVAGISSGRLPCSPNSVSVYFSARQILDDFDFHLAGHACGVKDLQANEIIHQQHFIVLIIAVVGLLIEVNICCCLVCCWCCCGCCGKEKESIIVSSQSQPAHCPTVQSRPIIVQSNCHASPKSKAETDYTIHRVNGRAYSKTKSAAAISATSQTRLKDSPPVHFPSRKSSMQRERSDPNAQNRNGLPK